MNGQTENGQEKRARGIEVLLNGPTIPTNGTKSEELLTADAIRKVLEAIATIPERQVSDVFAAVQAIRRTAQGETVAEIKAQLDERDRLKRERARESKRRVWGMIRRFGPVSVE